MRNIETFLFNHLAGQNVGKKIVRKTSNSWESSSTVYWFYVLFCDCDWLQWNDRKGMFFCLLFNKVIRDIYCQSTLEIQAKLDANWLPRSRNRNWGNIFILSVRKVVFCVRVIFVCTCSHLSNCHLHTVVNNVTCHIPTFWSSLNGSFIAAEPYWLISRVKIVGIWNIIASCRRPVVKPLPCP